MKDAILSLIRHALTAGGGGLVANGTATNDEWQQLVGAIITIIGIVWSIWQRQQAKAATLTPNPALSPTPPPRPTNPITKIAPLLLCSVLLAPSFFTGCASPETTAFRTVAAVGVSANTAHNIWLDYVASGKAAPADVAKARRLWNCYCAAYAIACDTGKSFATTQDKATLDAALKNLVQWETDVIAFIKATLPPETAAKL